MAQKFQIPKFLSLINSWKYQFCIQTVVEFLTSGVVNKTELLTHSTTGIPEAQSQDNGS
jgi:hypothetical protein